MKTTKEMIEVMQAYDEGKQIQYRLVHENEWTDWTRPWTIKEYKISWDWSNFDYRIKPEVKEPQYCPYESVDEMIEDYKERFNVNIQPYIMPTIWVQLRFDKFLKLPIIGYCNGGVRIGNKDDNDDWITFDYLFDIYTYLDSSPCGKLVK